MEKNNEQKYIEALIAAKANFGKVVLDQTNKHFGSRYASLNSVMTAVEIPLLAAGFIINHTTKKDENGEWVLKTMIEHKIYGDPKPSYYPLNCQTDHKLASSNTYGKRLTISNKLGLITEEDDDGNATSGYEEKSKPAKKNPCPWTYVTKACGVESITEKEVRELLGKHGIKTDDQLRNFTSKEAIKIIKESI